MRRVLPFLTVLISLSASVTHAADIQVVLLAGQSNAEGRGTVSRIPETFVPDTSVRLWHSARLNRGAGTEETWQPLRSAGPNAAQFGPELSLGTALAKGRPGTQWAIVKHARGATNLHKQWNPSDGARRGPEFRMFMETTRRALQALRDAGHTPHICAMVWMQGCADARSSLPHGTPHTYAKRLHRLVGAVRSELNCPEMAFVFGQVMPKETPRLKYREVIRRQQQAILPDSGTKYALPGTYYVLTDDLQMRRNEPGLHFPTDDVHFGTQGVLELGERFANVILALPDSETKPAAPAAPTETSSVPDPRP